MKDKDEQLHAFVKMLLQQWDQYGTVVLPRGDVETIRSIIEEEERAKKSAAEKIAKMKAYAERTKDRQALLFSQAQKYQDKTEEQEDESGR